MLNSYRNESGTCCHHEPNRAYKQLQVSLSDISDIVCQDDGDRVSVVDDLLRVRAYVAPWFTQPFAVAAKSRTN